MSHQESNRYVLNTLHRGRLIQILLAALFAVAFTVSRLPAAEMVKIIIVLFSLPAILFVSIRYSRQPSAWTLSEGTMRIDKNGVQHSIQLDDIAYVRNHIRSGGEYDRNSPKVQRCGITLLEKQALSGR